MEELKKLMRQAKEILPYSAGVIDLTGKIIAATDEELLDTTDSSVRAVLTSDDLFASTADRIYYKILIGEQPKYVVYINSNAPDSQVSLKLLSEWIKTALKEKGTDADKIIFIRNVLLDNEIREEIPMTAREFKIDCKIPRLVMVVRTTADKGADALELLQNYYTDEEVASVIAMDETTSIVIVNAQEAYESEDSRNEFIESVSQALDTCLTSEGCEAHVAVGSLVRTFQEISKSYSDAMTALKVSKIFEGDNHISRYDKLGLGRLIYQLPRSLCEMFIDEVFPDEAYKQLDDETKMTIETFFNNDLNGSETSRELFVHRNTLVYRLEKVKLKTGLDLRLFEDAVLFKMATMVRTYIDYLDASNDKMIR
ncbi:carbohydrate diacid regulator [Ruminococcaceae bacterium YRB3002]|nr:carbohydrate diacid regulator [Ruminococcaceae bacterium YRB3002]